jgi:Protein of unknown function (DUF3313)
MVEADCVVLVLEERRINMNPVRWFVSAAAIAALFLSAPLLAQSKQQKLEEALSVDGLQKISVKGIDLAFALPGATLSGYKRLMLDPVSVSFHKDFKPQVTGSRRNLSGDELQQIRDRVAKAVQDSFAEELTKGGYTVVTEAGPDVLRVRPAIINLYATAPDVMTPGRSRVYTVSAGEMTLVAELVDSETNQVIARVLDRYQSQDMGTFNMSSSVSNAAEVRRAASTWARILRTSLDKAKDIGKT